VTWKKASLAPNGDVVWINMDAVSAIVLKKEGNKTVSHVFCTGDPHPIQIKEPPEVLLASG
jgi:hypothetical protein